MLRAIQSLLIIVFLCANNSFAVVPTAPTLTLTVTGLHIQASWLPLPSATGYELFYAPYPSAIPISSLDMGSTLNLEVDLPAGAAFYVAIQAYNDEGNSEFSNIEFFVLATADSPTIITVSPEASSDGAATQTNISVTFSEEMNGAEIISSNANIFTLKDTYFDRELSGNISASNDNQTFTFNPHQDLEEGKEYLATISTNATNLTGNPLTESYSWSFTVGAIPIANFVLPFDLDDILVFTISPFGPIRRASDTTFGHGGIDIPLPENAPFYAASDGVIISVEIGSGNRGGHDVTILLRTDGVTNSGWYLEYEHITLEAGITVGSLLSQGQLFATNPGTAANNHIEFGYWNGSKIFSKKCWVDFLESSDFVDYFNNTIRTDSRFIDTWTSVQDEGFYPIRGLLDSELYPDGAQLCYELGTDVRIEVN